jgi:hypothetical protein
MSRRRKYDEQLDIAACTAGEEKERERKRERRRERGRVRKEGMDECNYAAHTRLLRATAETLL